VFRSAGLGTRFFPPRSRSRKRSMNASSTARLIQYASTMARAAGIKGNSCLSPRAENSAALRNYLNHGAQSWKASLRRKGSRRALETLNGRPIWTAVQCLCSPETGPWALAMRLVCPAVLIGMSFRVLLPDGRDARRKPCPSADDRGLRRKLAQIWLQQMKSPLKKQASLWRFWNIARGYGSHRRAKG